MTPSHQQQADVPIARDGETEEMLPEREVQFPPTTHWAHRRPLGLGPASLLAAVAVGALVLAIVTFALGSWIAGLIFMVIAATAACLFVVAVRREPDSQSARLATTAADRADGLIRLTAVRIRAWSRGVIELARIWRERRRLRAQFKRRLAPLGEAIYRDDPARAEQLKAQAEQFDHAIQEADRRASTTLAALHKRIEQERVPAQRTERLPVLSEGGGSDRNGRR
jgi:type IV secretory pathway TrbD component